jgi:hypothetical protein
MYVTVNNYGEQEGISVGKSLGRCFGGGMEAVLGEG